MDYLNKYLKYKSKYLKLKKQKGGNNEITGIISFNVLNPAPHISYITFKSSEITPKEAKRMGYIDEIRFNKYRLNLIIEFIKQNSKNNIICLQEVNKYMLDKFKAKCSELRLFVYHTNGQDTLKSQNIRKEEYRVIISPIELKTITIDLEYKQAIGCYINDTLIINVHLYIDLTDIELKETLETLNKNGKSIIIGDFNREYNDELFNEYNKAHNDVFTFIHNKNEVKYDNAISKDIKLGELKVIENFNDKQILYDVNEIYTNYKQYLNVSMSDSIFMKYLREEVDGDIFKEDIFEGKYLSDHKPIYLELPK